MTDVTTLHMAIEKHARWKHYLRQAINSGESEWTVAAVEQAGQCEFGQWLEALAPTDRASSHCQEIEELHREFHKVAARVLGLALAGEKENATKELAIGSDFAKTSSELVVAITKWKKAIEAK